MHNVYNEFEHLVILEFTSTVNIILNTNTPATATAYCIPLFNSDGGRTSHEDIWWIADLYPCQPLSF